MDQFGSTFLHSNFDNEYTENLSLHRIFIASVARVEFASVPFSERPPVHRLHGL